MTFATRTFQGMPQGAPVAFAAGAGNILTSTGIRSATITMLSDGTGSGSRTPSGGTGVAFCNNWFAPAPSPGIGSVYYCKLVIVSNANTNISGAAVNTVISCGGASWTFTNNATNAEGTGSANIFIYADPAGTSLVATGGVSWDVGFAP